MPKSPWPPLSSTSPSVFTHQQVVHLTRNLYSHHKHLNTSPGRIIGYPAGLNKKHFKRPHTVQQTRPRTFLQTRLPRLHITVSSAALRGSFLANADTKTQRGVQRACESALIISLKKWACEEPLNESSRLQTGLKKPLLQIHDCIIGRAWKVCCREQPILFNKGSELVFASSVHPIVWRICVMWCTQCHE